MKIFKDSKELPLFNYERIIETGDFYYMIKGYEGGDIDEESTPSIDPEKLKAQFNDIVKDYSLSINAKSTEIILVGKIETAKMNILKFSTLLSIIELKEQENHLRKQFNQEIEWDSITQLLLRVKIRKSDNLTQQKRFLEERIAMWRNNLEKAVKEQEEIRKENTSNTTTQNINDAIVNVEMILERSIDMHKTSLYRFGKLQEMAVKKIENHHQKTR